MAEAKHKILIVEDDLDVAEMLNAYFRVQGYEVFTVNWGEDGVRAGQTIFPDLVILIIEKIIADEIPGRIYARNSSAVGRHYSDAAVFTGSGGNTIRYKAKLA